MSTSLGRNHPCRCGSGKKYKSCHLDADEKKARESREQAAAAAPAAEAKTDKPAPRHATFQPWKGGAQNTRGFGRVNATRKVGGS